MTEPPMFKMRVWLVLKLIWLARFVAPATMKENIKVGVTEMYLDAEFGHD